MAAKFIEVKCSQSKDTFSIPLDSISKLWVREDQLKSSGEKIFVVYANSSETKYSVVIVDSLVHNFQSKREAEIWMKGSFKKLTEES